MSQNKSQANAEEIARMMLHEKQTIIDLKDSLYELVIRNDELIKMVHPTMVEKLQQKNKDLKDGIAKGEGALYIYGDKTRDTLTIQEVKAISLGCGVMESRITAFETYVSLITENDLKEV